MKTFKKNLKKLKKSYIKAKVNEEESFTYMNKYMDTELAGSIVETIKKMKA